MYQKGRAWIELDIDNLAYNIRQFRKIKSNVSQECKYNFKRQSSVALDALDSICDRQDTDD